MFLIYKDGRVCSHFFEFIMSVGIYVILISCYSIDICPIGSKCAKCDTLFCIRLVVLGVL